MGRLAGPLPRPSSMGRLRVPHKGGVIGNRLKRLGESACPRMPQAVPQVEGFWARGPPETAFPGSGAQVLLRYRDLDITTSWEEAHPGARASRPHALPLPAAQFPRNAPPRHPPGGNATGSAQAESWRPCRSIRAEEMVEALPVLCGRGARAPGWGLLLSLLLLDAALAGLSGGGSHCEPGGLMGMRSMTRSSIRTVLDSTPSWVVSMRTSSAP